MAIFTFIVLFTLFSLSYAQDSSSSSAEFRSDYIRNLNVDDFYKLLETTKDEIIFTRFYRPSCPACEEFHEEWHMIAKELRGLCIVVDYNCHKDPDTCWYVGVEGFPEFAVFKNNRLIALFDDNHYNFRRLVKFIKEKEYLQEEYRRKVRGH